MEKESSMPEPVVPIIMSSQDNSTGRFDIAAVAASFPPTAATLLLDHYLVNRQAASARVFRVYQSTPPHYHLHCDEYLYVFSGRGTFWTNDESGKAEFCPGQLLFFERGTVHAMPDILEGPVVFLSIDTPRREPDDVHFVNPADGTAASFIQPNKQ
jgi:mannose-6-phosphate isomerase-like protein (cupin superfamily)